MIKTRDPRDACPLITVTFLPSRYIPTILAVPLCILSQLPSSRTIMPNGKNGANGHPLPPEQWRIARILTEATKNMLSQSKRILPDIELLQGFTQTFLAGGVIDDRTYLVCASCTPAYTYAEMPRVERDGVFEDTETHFLGRLSKSSSSQRPSPTAPRSGMTSTASSSTSCGTRCSTRRYRTSATSSSTEWPMAPTTHVESPPFFTHSAPTNTSPRRTSCSRSSAWPGATMRGP